MFFQFLVLFIGILDATINSEVTSSQCYDVIYILPNPSLMSWSEAQSTCRDLNATLPIVNSSDRQSCFISALERFNLSSADGNFWLGSNSSGGDNGRWRWIDGRQYNGTAGSKRIMDGSNQGDYAYYVHVVPSTSSVRSDFNIGSSKPTMRHSFTCQFPKIDHENCAVETRSMAYLEGFGCYAKYNDSVSWFRARNNCLSMNGDLASFNDLDILRELVEPDKDEYWIGLRREWWDWNDAVTGWIGDVIYNLWARDQPDGNGTRCLSTNITDYKGWRSVNCNTQQRFICQRTSVMPTVPPKSSSAAEEVTPTIDPRRQETTGGSNIALSVGIGVGIGVPFLLAVIAVLALICRKHRKRIKRKKKFEKEANTAAAATATATTAENAGNLSKSEYASVSIVKKPDPELIAVDSSDSGVNYAAVAFRVEDTNDENS